MKRDMNAELHIDQEPVQCRVDFRIRRRMDDPDTAARFFAEGDIGERRRQAVIGDGELDGLTVIGATEDRETVHSLGRGVKAQSGVVGEKWVLRERQCIATTGDDLIERYARLRRSDGVRIQPHGPQCAIRVDALRRQRFGDHREFRDWIDLLVGACLDHRGGRA
jgi:hypothetical protein